MAQGRTPQGKAVLGMFERFVHSEVSGSVVLMACTVAALVWANSGASESYFALASTKIGVSWGDARFSLSLQHWVNDALMAVFFFVVGLEIKRELVLGRLSSVRRAALPGMAALGGMVVPAAAYALLNAGGDGSAGWGIPMATDIAFALGVLALLGSRVPVGLKVFLTALAIVDDLGAVLVIAVFYTHEIRWSALGIAALFLGLIALANLVGVRRWEPYVPLALGVWVGVLASGVHATVAGILVAMLVPVRARRDPEAFLATAEARVAELRQAQLTRESMLERRAQLDAILDLHQAAGDMRPPGLMLEESLHPLVALLILPLFALWNAGVVLGGGGGLLESRVSLGILLGLVLGKQLGILLFAWIAVRVGWAALPEDVTWSHVYGGACLAGIGFTMSLFVSELAFGPGSLLDQSKLGILLASLVAAVWGFLFLRVRLAGAVERGA
jgi:NhaA family Na+:H+ antiporter